MAQTFATPQFTRLHSAYRTVVSYAVPDLEFLLRRATKPFATVLDVGCGAASSPFTYFSAPVGQSRTGIDLFEKSLNASRAAGVHQHYVLGDIFALAQDDTTPRYECVVALDVVEHFEKQRGFEFIRILERLATKRVILFTPNGFLPQEPYDGNEFQRHLSGWTTPELRKLGYRVHGAHGLKPLRGEYAIPTVRPQKLGLSLALASQYVAVAIPQAAFHLFAVKDLA